MCYKQVSILNPKKHFNEKVDKLFLRVPCGHCGACSQRFNDDWFTRIYYEYKYTVDHGGYGFFDTLTYSEDHVPEKFGMKCFSNSHIKTFFKNLRESLRRDGFTVSGSKEDPTAVGDISWIIVSEYGGQTFRPHYHPLFFVRNQEITPEYLNSLIIRSWSVFHGTSRLQKGAWRESLGFTATTNPDPRRRKTIEECVVKSPVKDGVPTDLIGYVDKYVCKSFDFFRLITSQKGSSGYTGPALSDMTKEDKYDFFPFHRQCNGFGLHLVDYVDFNDLVRGRIKVPDREKGEKVVSLPRYFDKKLFYDYIKSDKTYVLTERGLHMKAIRDLHNRNYVYKSYRFILDNIDKFWTPLFAKKYSYVSTPSDFVDEVNRLLDGRSLYQLADYTYTYKDVVDTASYRPLHASESVLLMSRIGSDSSFNLRDSVREGIMIPGKGHRIIVDGHTVLEHLRLSTYNHTRPEFSHFDEVIDLFNTLTECYGDTQQLAYLERKREESRQKQKFHLTA